MLNKVLQIIRVKIQAISNLSSEYFSYLRCTFSCVETNGNNTMFYYFKKNVVIKFSFKLSHFSPCVTHCHFRNKKIKARSMNKMNKKRNIRVVYIHDYKIQLLIKENICNLQELIVPLFMEATTENERHFNK